MHLQPPFLQPLLHGVAQPPPAAPVILASANPEALHLHQQHLQQQHGPAGAAEGAGGAGAGAPPAAVVTREEVIQRVEGFVRVWLAVLADPDVTEPPTFEVLRRDVSNVTLVNQPPQQPQQGAGAAAAAAAGAGAGAGAGGAPLPFLMHGEAMVVKRLWGQQARSYSAIFAILAFVHKLLLSGQRATSRELFYNLKTAQAGFRVQSDADSAVLDAASLLGVSRHQLGIVGAAKGLLAGRIRFRVRYFEPALDEQGQQQQGPGVARVGEWQDCSTGLLVDSDWMTEVMEIELASLRPPRAIVVVEKESVFQRLVADGAIDMANGLILITGKGYPDLTTRACLKALEQALRIPVVGLCDCNPYVDRAHGIALLLTYKLGSSRMPESHKYIVNLKWLGLRPLQVLGRLDLPDDAFQPFSPNDQAKARVLLESAFCATHSLWWEEVDAMARENLKCELETLNLVPTSTGRRDALAQFVQRALLQGDFV